MELFIDYRKISEALRYIWKYNTQHILKKKIKISDYLSSRGIGLGTYELYRRNVYLKHVNRRRLKSHWLPNLVHTNKIFKEFGLKPERFVYIAEERKDGQPFNPSTDLEDNALGTGVVYTGRLLWEGETAYINEQLQDLELAVVKEYRAMSFVELMDLMARITEALKAKFHGIRLNIVVPQGVKTVAYIEVAVSSKVSLVFKFIRKIPTGRIITCVDIKNSLVNESNLSRKAYDVFNREKLVQYFTLIERERNIYGKIL